MDFGEVLERPEEVQGVGHAARPGNPHHHPERRVHGAILPAQGGARPAGHQGELGPGLKAPPPGEGEAPEVQPEPVQLHPGKALGHGLGLLGEGLGEAGPHPGPAHLPPPVLEVGLGEARKPPLPVLEEKPPWAKALPRLFAGVPQAA